MKTAILGLVLLISATAQAQFGQAPQLGQFGFNPNAQAQAQAQQDFHNQMLIQQMQREQQNQYRPPVVCRSVMIGQTLQTVCE